MTDQTPMTETDLEAIRSRLAELTDGPWIAEFSGETGHCVIPHDAHSTREAIALMRGYYAVADGEFAAHARTDVPRLLDEVDRLRAEIGRLSSDLEESTELLHTSEARRKEAEAARSELSDAMTVAYESMTTLSERGAEAVRERDALRAENAKWREVGAQADQGLKEATVELDARNNEITRMGQEIVRANGVVEDRDALAARLDAALTLHPVQANPSTDSDGYAEDTVPYCPQCRTEAPCSTRRNLDPRCTSDTAAALDRAHNHGERRDG